VKILIFVFPIALLVAYSQIVVKWRALNAEPVVQNVSFLERVLEYLSDPLILSAYGAALLASFVWLYVVTKLPLVVAFPVYIGVTFALVILGGWLFLSESINFMRLLSILLILAGVIIGVRN
jgi:multidrug transporter EmrE-like cation transporter